MKQNEPVAPKQNNPYEMISFVNAKINIGLQIVGRRPDGYHNLETIFYPVGLHAGTALNPVEFCDFLEIIPTDCGSKDIRFATTGRSVDCPREKNLVWRAADLFMKECRHDGFSVSVHLDKHLPDGAGMGGGSADAAFTLSMLSELEREIYSEIDCISDGKLREMALMLGADCPFFLLNRPAFAEGVGEKLQPLDLDLTGYTLLVVKPGVSVSTREAFAGVTPRPSEFDLRRLSSIPIVDWKDCVVNDFELSIFPRFPEFGRVKEQLYRSGSLYASLTGSGSCLYGIYADRFTAEAAEKELNCNPTITASYLLEF